MHISNKTISPKRIIWYNRNGEYMFIMIQITIVKSECVVTQWWMYTKVEANYFSIISKIIYILAIVPGLYIYIYIYIYPGRKDMHKYFLSLSLIK